MKRIAAIDVGSNAIRLAIGELKVDGRIEIARTVRAPVRLGRDVFKDGWIHEKTMKKCLKAFEKFHKLLKKYKVRSLMAVATSAARESKNGKELTQLIAEKTGIHVCIIDGLEEARLINLAVTRAVDASRKWAAFIDIGGGSLEISLMNDGKQVATSTFKMGTVRLMTSVGGDPKHVTTQKLDAALKNHEKSVQDFISQHLQGNSLELCAGTGGNIESLGKLRMQLLGKSAANFLFLDELDALISRLSQMSYEERIKKLDLRSDRADVILPASLALRLVMKLLNANELLIPYVGLKDGVLEHIKNLKDHGRVDKTCACTPRVKHSSHLLSAAEPEGRP